MIILQYEMRRYVGSAHQRIAHAALLHLQAGVHVLRRRALGGEVARVQIHLLQDRVLGVVQLDRRASTGAVLGGGRARGRHLDRLSARCSLGCQPLLLLQLKLGLYTAQIVELLLLDESLLLLALRREDALVVLENQDFVLILLWHACCYAHVIRGQHALICDRGAVGHADRSQELGVQVDVHVCQFLARVGYSLHGHFGILLNVQRLAALARSVADLLCRRNRHCVCGAMLGIGNLLLAAYRLCVIQTAFAIVATLPRLHVASASSLIGARA